MKLDDTPAISLVIVFLGAALVVFFVGVSVVLAVGKQAPTELWAAGSAVSGALVGLLVRTPGQENASSSASLTAGDATHDAAVKGAELSAQQQGQQDPHLAAAANDAVEAVRNLRGKIQATNVLVPRSLPPAAAAAAAARTARQLCQALANDATKVAGGAQARHAELSSALPGHVDQTGVDQAKQAVAEAEVKRKVQSDAASRAAASEPPAVQQGVDAASGIKEGTTMVWSLAGLLLLFLAIGIALSFIPSESDQTIKDAAKAVIALASSAGGALVGLFVPSPANHGT